MLTSPLRFAIGVSLGALCALLFSCTGAINQEQIRKGNYSAPEEYQVAEDCKSPNSNEDCKVVISYPPESPKKDSE